MIVNNILDSIGNTPLVRIKNLIEENDATIVAKLTKKEGLFVGPSSGAAMYVALQKAKELGKGKIIVVIFQMRRKVSKHRGVQIN